MKKRWLSIMTIVCVLTANIQFSSAAVSKYDLNYEEIDVATSSDAKREQSGDSKDKKEDDVKIQNSQDLDEKLMREIQNNVVDSGSCGDELTWTLFTDGVFIISGKGKMVNFPNTDVTWSKYRQSILELKIEDGVESIGNYAFCSCNNIKSVVIPESVTSIGEISFTSCDNLMNVIIGDNVVTIGSSAFEACGNLKEVIIGKGVNSIQSRMFFGCKKLTRVTMSENIKSINESAFDFCNNLTDIYYSGDEKQWNNISVSDKNDPLFKATIHFKNIENECLKFNGSKYQLFDKLITWEEAKKFCEEQGGHLATITSQEENDAVYNYITNLGYQSAYFGLKKTNGIWNWVTGENFKYVNWASGEENNENNNEIYGMFYWKYQNGNWNDGGPDTIAASSNNSPFICEWELGENTEVAGSDKLEFNGHFYQVIDESLSWEKAKQACEKLGGHLATITYQKEQEFIQSLLISGGKKKQYWIGARYIDDNFAWITEEDFVYTNWDEKEPDLSMYKEEREEYVQILNEPNPSDRRPNSQRFKWNDMFCDNIFPGEENFFDIYNVGYICEWDVSNNEFTHLELPILSEESARAFLGFLYNKSDIKDADLSQNELYLLMTGKIIDPEEQYKAGITFITVLNNQMENHLKKSSKAKEYLNKDLRKYFEKKMEGMNNLSEEIYNNILNQHMGQLESFITDVLCTSVNGLTNIVITESMLNELKLAFSAYSKMMGLGKKIENFVDGTKAFVQMGFLILESEFEGRYKYFDLYLEQREIFEPSDDSFRYIMDVNKVILSDNNFVSGLLSWIFGISTWQKQVPIIEAWAEYTYQLQSCLNQAEKKNKFLNGNYQNIFIQCPVSVFIMNNDGKEVGSICKGKIINNDSENLYLYQLGDSKVVCITNDCNYKIEIIAENEGLMSYSNKIIENHDEVLRYNYYMLPLKVGEKYIATNSKEGQYKELKRVRTSGYVEILEPMEIIEKQKKEVFLKVKIKGNGEIIGNAKYIKGDYVYLKAFSYDTALFLGWYENDICISKNPELAFTILDNMEYTAVFSDDIEVDNSENDAQEDNIPGNNDEESGNQGNDISNNEKPGDTIDKPEPPKDPDDSGKQNDSQKPEQPGSPEKPGKPEPPKDSDDFGKPDDSQKPGQSGSPEKPESSGSGGSSHGGGSGSSQRTGEITSIPYIYSGIWEQSVDKWRFILDNGSYARMSWVYYKDKWYFIGQDGYMLIGWQFIAGEWYYFHPDGSMAVGWIIYDHQKYYLNPLTDGSQGKMLTGWQLVEGKWHYFKEESDGTKGMLLADTWMINSTSTEGDIIRMKSARESSDSRNISRGSGSSGGSGSSEDSFSNTNLYHFKEERK